jgi:hypothetical protein
MIDMPASPRERDRIAVGEVPGVFGIVFMALADISFDAPHHSASLRRLSRDVRDIVIEIVSGMGPWCGAE